MKKIILVFDGIHFSEGAFNFANKLNELSPILLTGVFLPQSELANTLNYLYEKSSADNPELESEASVMMPKNVEHFKELCIKNGIDFRVHVDENDYALSELKQEGKFADLLIVDSESYYKGIGTDAPNDYLKEALRTISCPTIVIPQKCEFPESIILTYDGTDDSIYAIKLFAYLFPELSNKKTLLVYADEDPNQDFPYKVQIEELVARHFSDLSLFKLDLNPKKYFGTWVIDQKSVILVSGSYGRSDWSRLFRKSFIDEVIADHHIPVFIAHK